VLALKENQGNLYEDVVRLFNDLESSQFTAYKLDYDKTIHNDHGRIVRLLAQNLGKVITHRQLLQNI
jgi:hypothetical protein